MQASSIGTTPSVATLMRESLTKSSQERAKKLSSRLDDLRVDHEFYMLVAKGELQGSEVIINSMRALQEKRVTQGYALLTAPVLRPKAALNWTASPTASAREAVDEFEGLTAMEQSIKDIAENTLALKAMLSDISEGADERLQAFRQQLKHSVTSHVSL